ncbi:polysaccharide pyruvyl transferase family protein [Neotabrizicola shimadae]|uniref:Polysaccharide pyruvyl transferase family protein n=1 Tax=Neotabrizicola shimadae TaxID=2807096 RepID=A0A8G0ZUE3_9RHOB|nr:polysaccharide pyruvyl transferase family protein [Neotabrizicola shimadae]QYZ70247.1 polysaccharide pyruvyl transferase family protein [Neotabrizicola shimadae]
MTLRALIAGTFDVDNYGDLLFPLVAAHRLAPHGIEVVPVSPTDRPVARLPDAPQPIGVAEMLSGTGPLDGILIGGGYIVHKIPAATLAEYTGAGVADWAYPGLWIGATLAGALRDVPVIWNAPGVPFPFGGAGRRALIGDALHAGSHLCVRDPGSAEFLEPAYGSPVPVVPDTVLGLARLWTVDELSALHADLLKLAGLPAGTRTLALHVRPRSLGALGPAELAGQIDRITADLGLVPLLVAIGPSFDDGALARDIAGRLTGPHICLDAPASLRQTAAAIAGSTGYVGASMHGYVTAAAYDVPGVMVARPAHRKYSGLVGQLGRPADLVRDWAEAFEPLARNLAAPAGPVIPAAVHQALDRHWQTVARILQDGDPARRPRQRRFLARYMLQGLRGQGADWLFQPFVRGAA